MGSAYKGNLFTCQTQSDDCCQALGDDPMRMDKVKAFTAQQAGQSPKLAQEEEGGLKDSSGDWSAACPLSPRCGWPGFHMNL